MISRVALAILMATNLLTGCTTVVDTLSDKVTLTVIENGPRGEAPTEHEKVIKQYFHGILKDPFSVQYKQISNPEPGHYSKTVTTKPPSLINTDVQKTETRHLGWLVTAEINAKNSYGAYTGWKTYKFIFRNNNIIYVDEPSTHQ